MTSINPQSFHWKRLPLAEKIATSVITDANGCEVWQLARFRNGYGRIKVNRKDSYAHRVVWELTFGEIPEGLFVCHRCDNPPCVNIDHLFLGTPMANTRDKIRKGRNPVQKGGVVYLLTPEDVVKIRDLHATGDFTFAALGRMFGVHYRTISMAVNRKTWAHIP